MSNRLNPETPSPENAEFFVCPQCHAGLQVDDAGMLCRNCNERYSYVAGIPQFYQSADVWQISAKGRPGIESVGDWKEFLRVYFPDADQRSWVSDTSRTMTLGLAGINEGARILDVGAGWGIYSIGAARLGAHVWAIDSNPEGLAFLKKRCQMENCERIVVAQASALRLPFADNSFDFVMFNGVLELLPEYITEGSPEQIQSAALREAGRVLRPGGRLSIAIENRYGLPYLTGSADEHTGLRFVTLLPRRLASIYSRMMRRKAFRIYTHSVKGLKRLLREAGLVPEHAYGAYPNYRFPDFIYSLVEPMSAKYLAADLRYRNAGTFSGRVQSKVFRLLAEFSSLPEYMLQKFPCSMVVVGSKGRVKKESPLSMGIRATRMGWLEDRREGGRSVLCRCAIEEEKFEAFRHEGDALKYFAGFNKGELVPSVVREEVRPGARIRVLEKVGHADFLLELKQSGWAVSRQVEGFTGFLRWHKSARNLSGKGFAHKYEVMPWIPRILAEDRRVVRFAADGAVSAAQTMLSNADFNPGNIGFAKGELVVFDWECPCREHPIMVLAHFFIQMTLFADRYPPVFKSREKRPERCLGDIFRKALYEEISRSENRWLGAIDDVFLWIATDFRAQFRESQVAIPDVRVIVERLSKG
jgi:ubiquinone/menaquinone biosynthesis C-methylase UbiE